MAQENGAEAYVFPVLPPSEKPYQVAKEEVVGTEGLQFRKSKNLGDIAAKGFLLPKGVVKGIEVEEGEWVQVTQCKNEAVTEENPGAWVPVSDLFLPMKLPGAEGEPMKEVLVMKKSGGKPKDAYAPPKPKNGFQKNSQAERKRLKEEEPEVAADLSKVGLALKDAWEKVPQAQKDRMQEEYEKEMVIWKPKWEAYKQTQHYKEFFEVRQDWVDIKMQKNLKKKMSGDAPKRPKSGYMLYAGEIRERVQKEVFDAGGGMADIGKKISENWASLTETQKASYGETSLKQKAVFDVEFAKYKKTDGYGNFMDAKNKMECKQKTVKSQRISFYEAPKRAASAYALFRNKAMPKIAEENKGKGCGELGKLVAQAWAAVPEAEKESYREKAAVFKEKYDEDLKNFKVKDKYLKFLETRQQLKLRENRLVNLREQPKRPQSVFARYAARHKAEVPSGKGEGKGRSALKKKFETDLEETEKKELEELEKVDTDKWKDELQAFKDGPKFKAYNDTTDKVKKEFMNEAMKVMTLRFLRDAPAAPPRSPFAIYVGEKRRAENGGVDSNKKLKKEEVTKYKGEWLKLGKETKMDYDKQRKDDIVKFEQNCKEYMVQPRWQEYIKEAKRIRVPVQKLLANQKKVMKKLKNGMLFIPLPDKPGTFPDEKPPVAYKLFSAEKRSEVDSIDKLKPMWDALDAEGKKPFEEEAAKQLKAFLDEVKAFKDSAEGKKYYRECNSVLKRRRINNAKAAYLKEMPVKPIAALMKFMKDKYSETSKEVKKTKTGDERVKGHEVKKALNEKWQSMDADAKKQIEDAAKEKLTAFTEAMAAFKASENWKKYQSATKEKKAPKAKGKAGGPPAPKKPTDMPEKPLDAMKAFIKAQTAEGNTGDFMKMFRELPEEEKKKLQEEAAERHKEYQAKQAEFDKSVPAKKYRVALAMFQKRKRVTDLKKRFLKNEPKKSPNAFSLFSDKKRSEVIEKHPETKGNLGQVMAKISELWKNTSEDEKKEFQDLEKEQRMEYEEKLAEFQKSPEYKRYQIGVSRMNPSAKSKGKGKKVKGPVVIAGPKAPDNLPKKPAASGYFFFSSKSHEDGVKAPKAIAEAWTKLGAEGQKEYNDKAKEANVQYDKEMKEFTKTVEGKKYMRLKALSDRKNKEQGAKRKFLANAPKEPKRPASSYFLFVTEKRPSMPPGKMGDIAKQLSEMWSKVDKEEKKEWEDKAKEAKEKYEEEMKAYRANPNVKRFAQAVKGMNKSSAAKPKGKVVAKPKGRAAAPKSAPAAKSKSKAKDSSTDSDVMGSDSDDSSANDSDSD